MFSEKTEGAMRAGRYTFFCRFETDAVLPVFKGSTLRGGIGHALRRISCALRRQDCKDCLLVVSCPYAFFFETSEPEGERSGRPRIAHRPHPYVLMPPDEEKLFYGKGDSFCFSLLLFGRANDYLPHVVYAVQEAGREGLGKRNREPGRFLLESVRLGDDLVFAEGVLRSPAAMPRLDLAPVAAEDNDMLALSCLTPLRLKHDNGLQERLPFHVVIRAALRRVASLEAAYGEGEPNLDYRGIVARADAVQLVAAESRWVDYERYSNRQKSSMLFGGVMGRLLYQGGDLSEFLPLLHYCVTAHLGKQTAFGLGRISVTVSKTP